MLMKLERKIMERNPQALLYMHTSLRKAAQQLQPPGMQKRTDRNVSDSRIYLEHSRFDLEMLEGSQSPVEGVHYLPDVRLVRHMLLRIQQAHQELQSVLHGSLCHNVLH